MGKRIVSELVTEEMLADKILKKMREYSLETNAGIGVQIEKAANDEYGRTLGLQGQIHRLPIVDMLRKYAPEDMKVIFDSENIEANPGHGFADTVDDIIGFHKLDNGIAYLGLFAGGDWESPVFFMVYWDGSNIRAYIPTDGNPWNTSEMSAYGNHGDKDAVNAQERFCGAYEDVDDVPDLDQEKIMAEINSLIVVTSDVHSVAKDKSGLFNRVSVNVSGLLHGFKKDGETGEEAQFRILFEAEQAVNKNMGLRLHIDDPTEKEGV